MKESEAWLLVAKAQHSGVRQGRYFFTCHLIDPLFLSSDYPRIALPSHLPSAMIDRLRSNGEWLDFDPIPSGWNNEDSNADEAREMRVLGALWLHEECKAEGN